MTTLSKSTLKTYFEQLDVPSGSDYSNFIDSYVNLVETTAQSMAGPLYTTELITPNVSATTATFTTLTLTNGVIGSILSAATINAVTVSCGTGYVNTLNVTTLNSNLGQIGTVAIVSAAGTTQATGAAITAFITIGKGVTNDQATGFLLTAGKTGQVHYLVNETAVSANLWPPTDGVINALATNAAFPLAVNTTYAIIPKTTKTYSVK